MAQTVWMNEEANQLMKECQRRLPGDVSKTSVIVLALRHYLASELGSPSRADRIEADHDTLDQDEDTDASGEGE